MPFDKIVNKAQEGVAIRYGVVHGNDTIVFIKSGTGGKYDGYQQKYLRMAERVHAAQRGFADYTVCFVAHSDGWEQIIRTAKKMPQTRRLLGINPSFVDDEEATDDLRALPQAEKTLVYGTQDDDFYLAAKLEAAGIPRLRIITVDGADHDFTHRLEDFIALIDLL